MPTRTASATALLDRRRLLQAGLACAVPAWLAGCSGGRGLALGIHPWVGYESLYLADEFHWLPAGIRLVPGHAAEDSLAALVAGQLDGATLTLDEMIRAIAAGVHLDAVLVFDVSAGADVLLARPSITSLQALRGRRLALEMDALGLLVLEEVLRQGGLLASDLTLVDCPPDHQLAAWRAGTIDAAISYAPNAAHLVREGAHALFDSRQIPDTIFDVLAVRTDRAEAAGTALRALLAAHFRVLEYLRGNRDDALRRIARNEDLSVDEVTQVLGGVQLPSLAANRSYLGSATGQLATAGQRIARLLQARGVDVSPRHVAHLATPRWLPGTVGAP